VFRRLLLFIQLFSCFNLLM